MICNQALVFRATSLPSATIISRTSYTRPGLMPLTDRQKRLYPQVEQQFTEEGFPILKLMPSKKRQFDPRPKFLRRGPNSVFTPREEKLKDDVDWTSYWPTPKTFSPSAVPLVIRQSFERKRNNVSRGKYANMEILKVPNFLHIAPVAIEKHCNAIKKFCTKWPEGLDTDEEVRSHFPVTYITTDYVNSSPDIRDIRSRIVTLEFNIDDLKLKPRDKDKLIRLSRFRYNPETNIVSIEASACPLRVQNEDYSNYLITALYFESKQHEKWESEKPECDWEVFFWEKSRSKDKIKTLLSLIKPDVKEEEIEKGEGIVSGYKKSVENVFMDDNRENLDEYRRSVEKLIGIS